MLIIDKDNLQAFINLSPYAYPEGTPQKSFIVSFTIQINGKIKTTYANLYVVSKKQYELDHPNEYSSDVKSGLNYVIEQQREVLDTINTLSNLGYDCGDTMLMRDKISQYISLHF